MTIRSHKLAEVSAELSEEFQEILKEMQDVDVQGSFQQAVQGLHFYTEPKVEMNHRLASQLDKNVYQQLLEVYKKHKKTIIFKDLYQDLRFSEINRGAEENICYLSDIAEQLPYIKYKGVQFSTYSRQENNSFIAIANKSSWEAARIEQIFIHNYQVDKVKQSKVFMVIRRFPDLPEDIRREIDPFFKFPILRAKFVNKQLDQNVSVIQLQDIISHIAISCLPEKNHSTYRNDEEDHEAEHYVSAIALERVSLQYFI